MHVKKNYKVESHALSLDMVDGGWTKGQLISKCLFDVFNSSKKNELENHNFCPSLLGQKFFVRFLEELKKPKRHFEINRPLISVKKKCDYFSKFSCIIIFQLIVICERSPTPSLPTWVCLICWWQSWTVASTMWPWETGNGILDRPIVPSTTLWPSSL